MHGYAYTINTFVLFYTHTHTLNFLILLKLDMFKRIRWGVLLVIVAIQGGSKSKPLPNGQKAC